MARNLEGPFVPYDSRDYCRQPCTMDKRCRNCPGRIRVELSVPICSPVSVALSDPSVASVAVPVEVVVEVVVAVWKAVQQYYAPVALC